MVMVMRRRRKGWAGMTPSLLPPLLLLLLFAASSFTAARAAGLLPKFLREAVGWKEKVEAQEPRVRLRPQLVQKERASMEFVNSCSVPREVDFFEAEEERGFEDATAIQLMGRTPLAADNGSLHRSFFLVPHLSYRVRFFPADQTSSQQPLTRLVVSEAYHGSWKCTGYTDRITFYRQPE